MKKIIIFMLLSLGTLVSAQKELIHKKKNKGEFEQIIEQEKQKIYQEFKRMSREEKRIFFRKIQIQRIIDVLNISGEKQDVAKTLLQEYFRERDSVMELFKPYEVKGEVSDEELRKRILKGLDVAQKLLDIRKLYTEKFLQIFTPQQVIKIHKQEKEMASYFKSNRGHRKKG